MLMIGEVVTSSEMWRPSNPSWVLYLNVLCVTLTVTLPAAIKHKPVTVTSIVLAEAVVEAVGRQPLAHIERLQKKTAVAFDVEIGEVHGSY